MTWNVPGIARLGGGVLGLLLVTFGTLLIARPPIGPDLFGFGGGEDGIALMPAIGMREIAFGSALLLLAWRGEQRTLGYMLLVSGIVPIADAIMAWRASGPEKAILHLVAIPVCFLLAIALLRTRQGTG